MYKENNPIPSKKENVGTMILYRVPTLLTSLNSMTFNDFFPEPFKVFHVESLKVNYSFFFRIFFDLTHFNEQTLIFTKMRALRAV